MTLSPSTTAWTAVATWGLVSSPRYQVKRKWSKVHIGRFRLDIKKNFFMGRVVKYWNRLPREVMKLPSQEVLKRGVEVALWDVA